MAIPPEIIKITGNSKHPYLSSLFKFYFFNQ